MGDGFGFVVVWPEIVAEGMEIFAVVEVEFLEDVANGVDEFALLDDLDGF